MLKPTKKNQQAWIKRYLNGGVWPSNRTERWRMPFNTACDKAMNWLAESNIKTLAEAWAQCPYAAWLAWTLCNMQPDERDTEKYYEALQYLQDQDITADEYPRAGGCFATSYLAFCFASAVGANLDPNQRHTQRFKQENEQVLRLIRRLWPRPWSMK